MLCCALPPLQHYLLPLKTPFDGKAYNVGALRFVLKELFVSE